MEGIIVSHNAKHSLMRRFIALLLAMCLIVALSFGAMLAYVSGYSLAASTQVMNNMLRQAEARLKEYCRIIENSAYSLCYSPTIQGYLQTDSLSERIDMTDNLRIVHSGTYLTVDSLIGIAAFDTEGRYLKSSQSSLFTVDGLPERWQDVKGYQYTGLFPAGSLPGINKTSFAMLTPVYALGETTRLLGRRIGTILFTFDTLHLASILVEGTQEQGFHLILADAKGNLLASGSASSAKYYSSRQWKARKPAVELTAALEKGGWQLYGFLPESQLAAASIPLFVVIGITAMVFTAMLVLLITMMRRQILMPISRLSGFMARVPTDRQPKRFKVEVDNELGSMIRVMNQMLDELDKKNTELRRSEAHAYEAELAGKSMELLAYRNQINPHFLYNTLDCICSMAMYHGADEIAEVSESLSTMFHYVVKGDSFATVEQEAAYVQEYTSIIETRFQKRIRIHVDAAMATLSCRTIKLLLQPLVENAVFHGLERQTGPGSVTVYIRMTENGLLSICVKDDGIGMDAQTLFEVRESIRAAQTEAAHAPGTEKGIGLANIARRIHLYYEGKGSMEIESHINEGTCVLLTLPPLEGGTSCIAS